MSREPPLSLYVHLPWCVSKCPYCDFNSHAVKGAAPRERYLEAVETDLKAEASRAGDRPLVSVYIGGGTPSLFEGSEIARLIDVVASEFTLQRDAEISMEANPGTVERGRVRDYAIAGVNRLSLGAQSFDAATLDRLGRIHGPDEIRVAFEEATSAGFDSINLDIMFALPGQDLEMAVRDVEEATAIGPAHISYYQLTLEPNTVFHSNPPADLPDHETSFVMQSECHAVLADHGYRQYEVSAFARAGHSCRHNLNYWTFGDYLAAGAGAHGKITGSKGQILRYAKPRHPLAFIEQAEQGSIHAAERELAAADICFEFMLNALRLPRGFLVSDFTARTGLGIEAIEEPLEQAREKGMIEAFDGSGWRPTPLGMRFGNDLVALFLA
ncbi:MAG: radical SAM family heme chaperone HemW [Woeseiaceae bacterium]